MRQFADSIGANFIKTSAKTNYGVEQMFKDIAIKMNPELGSRTGGTSGSGASGSAAPASRARGVTIDKKPEGKAKEGGCC